MINFSENYSYTAICKKLIFVLNSSRNSAIKLGGDFFLKKY